MHMIARTIFAVMLAAVAACPAQQVDEAHDAMTSAHAQKMIEAGDARVIPTLHRWLAFGLLDDPAGMYSTREYVAIVGVGALNLVNEGPTLVALYRSPHADDGRKPTIAHAVGRMNSTGAVTFLRQLMNDSTLPPAGRGAAAVALVRLDDDDTAREFVIDDFQKQMASRKSGDDYDADITEEVGNLYDPPLMDRLKEALQQTKDPDIKEEIDSTLQRMALLHLSMSDLLKLADSVDVKKWWLHDEAIRVLGEVGTPDVIEPIKVLHGPMPPDASRAAGSERMFALLKARTIDRIRQRYCVSPAVAGPTTTAP